MKNQDLEIVNNQKNNIEEEKKEINQNESINEEFKEALSDYCSVSEHSEENNQIQKSTFFAFKKMTEEDNLSDFQSAVSQYSNNSAQQQNARNVTYAQKSVQAQSNEDFRFQYNQAEQLMNEQNLDSSFKHFDFVIDTIQKDESFLIYKKALQAKVDILFKQKNYLEAYLLLKQLQSISKDPRIILQKAQILFNTGKKSKAFQLLKDLKGDVQNDEMYKTLVMLTKENQKSQKIKKGIGYSFVAIALLFALKKLYRKIF